MEQNYLLTFDVFIKEINDSVQSYAWFEHEEDMEEFIENNNNITVSEKLKINSCEYL